MQSQPLFILGAPRSGTTFLCCALNQHPEIDLTNEGRIFVLLKDLLTERAGRPDLLSQMYQSKFQSFIRRNAGAWIEQFYRDELGLTGRIWGDKHPPYGDPAVLSGRSGAAMNEPRSGSCLALIRECLPQARFIHLHRHPWQVAASMRRRGWVPSITAGLQVWRQHVHEIDTFLLDLPPADRLVLSFAELIERPEDVASEIAHFLDLETGIPIRDFLSEQRSNPTPFSAPTGDLRRPLALPLPAEQQNAPLAAIFDMVTRFGYD